MRRKRGGHGGRPYRATRPDHYTADSHINRRNRRRRRKPFLFTGRMQRKLAAAFVVVLLAMLGLNYQITKIQKENGTQYAQTVLSQQGYSSSTIPYRRGDITDVNGTVLATSEEVYNLIIDAKQLNEKEEQLGGVKVDEKGNNLSYVEATLGAISAYFPDIDTGAIRTLLTDKPDNQYYVAAEQMTKDQIREFEAEMEAEGSRIVGVWFETEYLRKYPYSTLACDLLGFTVSGNVGLWGIEEYYNDTLNGVNGREYGYLNEDSEVQRTVKEAQDGRTVVSTIDVNIQSIVEKHIREFNEAHANEFREGLGSTSTSVIVMDPNDGSVLAMAEYPVFDLNNPRDMTVTGLYTQEQIDAMDEDALGEAYYSVWRNGCISDGIEPGSTVKPFTVAAGLELGRLSDGDGFTCVGKLHVGDHDISCSNTYGHGYLTTGQAIMKSCNSALMQMAQRIGIDDFRNYMRIYNFGQKTGIDLPGEASGLVLDASEMTVTDLATYSFGQGFTSTLIQVASGFSSLINGGTYYQPRVVEKIVDGSGATVQTMEPVVMKKTVSEKTSAQIREYLYETVAGDGTMTGTGATAAVAGYRIGGKTGTAEKLPRDKTNYIISFIGAAPIDDPQVLVYVAVDEPNMEEQAHSTYAQEIFRGIMEEILPYMNIFPTESTGEDTETDGEAAEEADGTAQGAEEGKEEESQEPQRVVVTDSGRVIDGMNIDPEYAAEHGLDPNTGEPLEPASVLPEGYTGAAGQTEDTMTDTQQEMLENGLEE